MRILSIEATRDGEKFGRALEKLAVDKRAGPAVKLVSLKIRQETERKGEAMMRQFQHKFGRNVDCVVVPVDNISVSSFSGTVVY